MATLNLPNGERLAQRSEVSERVPRGYCERRVEAANSNPEGTGSSKMRTYNCVVTRPAVFVLGLAVIALGLSLPLNPALQRTFARAAMPAKAAVYGDSTDGAYGSRAFDEGLSNGRATSKGKAKWELNELAPRKEAIELTNRADRRSEIRLMWAMIGVLLVALGSNIAKFGMGIRIPTEPTTAVPTAPRPTGSTAPRPQPVITTGATPDPAKLGAEPAVLDAPEPATLDTPEPAVLSAAEPAVLDAGEPAVVEAPTEATPAEPEEAAPVEPTPEPAPTAIRVHLTVTHPDSGTKELVVEAPADANVIIGELKLDRDPSLGGVEVYTHHNDGPPEAPATT